jgi:prepilin peptidase CpaA
MHTEKETQALLSLLWMLASDPRMLVLFALLLVASISDCRSYRIPNWLTFGGALFALLSAMLMARTPGTGALQALSGLAIGFVLLLPFYVLRVMGAGDVKLMAMVGAFLGAAAVFQAVLLSFIASGVVALAYAIYHRKLLRMLGNVKTAAQGLVMAGMAGMATTPTETDRRQSVGKLPFALCIGAGTLAQVVAAQLGYL